MPTSTTLKSSVTRRQPAFEPVDADERARQSEYHQAVQSAAVRPNEATTGVQTEPAVPKPRVDPSGLQSAFLTAHLGKPVTVFTINGVRLNGALRQWDQYCLLLEISNEQQLIFKHAISTITITTR